MKSRRRNRRLTIMGMGSLRVANDKRAQEIYIANVSKGGAGIYIHKALKAGTGVFITFTQREIDGERRFEEQPATIAWCSRCGSVYAAGVRFADNDK